MRAVTGTQVREAELPLVAAGQGPALMRRAAWGLAEHVAAVLRERGRVYGATVAALVGTGNNGGDALWALAFLRRRGVEAVAVPVVRDDDGAPRWQAEGAAALRAAGGRAADAVPARAAVVVDGILGTGARGGLILPAAARDLPADAVVVACDVPSGVDADTGAVAGEVLAAAHTVTFGAVKTGLLLGEGAATAGRVHLVDIGLDPHLPDEPQAGLHVVDRAAVLRAHPAPAPDAYKYTRGVVGLAAGSERYPGAAVLAVGGALAAGAGMAHVAGPDAVREFVLAAHPAVLASAEGPEPDRADAWVVGPGLGSEGAARARLERAVDAVLAADREAAEAPGLVLDASALELVTGEQLAALAAAGARVVLTPHAGEWARLRERLPAPEASADAGPGGADALTGLRAWAAAHGVTVLLKGPRTLVAAPDGEAWLMRDGGPALGTAGTGDVLAGVLGAVLAADRARAVRAADATNPAAEAPPGRPSPAALAAAAAWLHARAGTGPAAHRGAVAEALPAAVGAVTAALWWEDDGRE